MVDSRLARTVAGIAGVVIASVVLAGCSSTSLVAAHPSPSISVDAGPTVSPPPAGPSDVLFTVAANVRSKTGATIAIQLTAHKPLAYSNSKVKPFEADFLKACGAGVGGNPVTTETMAANGSILLPIDLASSVAGKPFVYPIDLSLGSPYFGQAVSGKGVVAADPTQACYGGYRWTTSGTAHALADFESGNPGPDLDLWRFAFYGFTVPVDSGATIEACKVTLSDFATTTVEGVDGWDPNALASGIACGIGYAGE